MEKQSKLKNKILKILPKAAAAITVTFQNPPFSPSRRSEKLKSHVGKGFSGPIMIPYEARRKPKDGGIETHEPTSPKISCMGQIKHKKNQIQKAKAKSMSMPKTTRSVVISSASSTPRDTEVKKKHASNKFQRMFFNGAKQKTKTRKSDADSASVGEEGKKGIAVAPPMGEMRRFASGRETFANFDWRAQIAPEEMDQRDCYSDEDRVESDAEEEEEEDEDEEEEDIIIPFSAPILVGAGACVGRNIPNLQPRKEINIWKRRTMAPPRHLQLNPVLTAK
ncbi:uncharacterized protein At1g76070-like [Gastrolobium bilobum]|uniref:uncharacterized protein At1g76070-like n=1 Tax=Gastrolobium bilobum TaxID=150636 RepID=UPI002AB26BEE|nr:uncharacterized protein At1g76070-like [Gastrolobium bilobum]